MAVEKENGAKEVERATGARQAHMAKEAVREKEIQKEAKETKETLKEDSKAIAGHADKLAIA